MPELDGVREEIAYLKLWLGIMIATGISLVAWFLNNFSSAHPLLVAGSFVGIMSVSFVCFVLHRRIEFKIERVKGL